MLILQTGTESLNYSPESIEGYMDTKDLYIVDGMGKFSIVAERIISNAKTLEEADAIIESEKIWISLQDYIREAVREKNERWKKEHAEKFHA